MKNKVSFNLKKFKREAYYEDAKSLVQNQSRFWMNCYKAKVDAGMSFQNAVESCMDEYQDFSSGEWSKKYASRRK